MLDNIEVLCHSSIRIDKNKIIYIDPFKIDKNYNDADIIFITHDHYDHYSEEDIDKVINENTVSIIDDYKNMLYKYSDETNTYILDKDGKEIIKVNKNDYLKNIDNYYIYIANNKINIYDIDKNKTNSYTMKDSEKMNDASGSMISPYKQTLVINNSTEKYVKVINFNGKVLKKIDNVELSKFKTNDEAEKAFLIVKKTKNNKDLYGLYVYQ